MLRRSRMILIPAPLIGQILGEVRATPEVEVCGLLLGIEGHVTGARATRNVSPEPERAFEIDPAALLAAMRQARAGGPALLGCYHSHPGGLPEPSARDAASAAPDGRLWLILGRDGGGLWRAVGRGAVAGRFDPAGWTCSDADGAHDMPACFGYGTLPASAEARRSSGGA